MARVVPEYIFWCRNRRFWGRPRCPRPRVVTFLVGRHLAIRCEAASWDVFGRGIERGSPLLDDRGFRVRRIAVKQNDRSRGPAEIGEARFRSCRREEDARNSTGFPPRAARFGNSWIPIGRRRPGSRPARNRDRHSGPFPRERWAGGQKTCGLLGNACCGLLVDVEHELGIYRRPSSKKFAATGHFQRQTEARDGCGSSRRNFPMEV